jgi:hypothetical protein
MESNPIGYPSTRNLQNSGTEKEGGMSEKPLGIISINQTLEFGSLG